ncbi:aromatic ring-opening dioxygenase [Ophiostoma piceae UAMH 11346]|uniref:Aromatic ring-opening dioxygenase n=1 Tax=Ophiostoma piceae (strain UAMH 11346) TaxID=1262450 RepID=S3BS12_OPHP1|nr:aromatic ring-opening dioxygenase [Ophiostoma piceae UAMH 11346]
MPSIINGKTGQPLPVYFIGHAGANLLFREDSHSETVRQNLRAIGREILGISPPPRAILTLSGHFEASAIHGPGVIEVNVKRNTPILHDFVNDFHDTRPELYEAEWAHHDSPELGTEVWKHLRAAGITAKRVERGLDHGIWVPFVVMFPGDDDSNTLSIPIVQVSTFHGDDLESQVRLGVALQSLRNEGYLIVGSGMAVHSFASVAEIAAETTEAGRDAVTKKVLHESRVLDDHIREATAKTAAQDRKEALLALEPLYEFKRSHPTVEHFTPLLVAAGAAGDAPVKVLGEDVIDPGFSYINLRFQ